MTSTLSPVLAELPDVDWAAMEEQAAPTPQTQGTPPTSTAITATIAAVTERVQMLLILT